MLSLKKLRNVTNSLGKECGFLRVKLFHKIISEERAKEIQTNHCKNIVRHYGLKFAEQVYKNVYVVMTDINLNRQKRLEFPIDFFTDGMDEYFKKLKIEPYDKPNNEA